MSRKKSILENREEEEVYIYIYVCVCMQVQAGKIEAAATQILPTLRHPTDLFLFEKIGAKSRWDTAESLTTGPDEDAHASQAKNLSTSATKLRGRPGPAVLLCNQRNPINLPAWRYKQHPLSFPPAPGILWRLAIFGCLPAG
jgi:hypothetical protein